MVKARVSDMATVSRARFKAMVRDRVRVSRARVRVRAKAKVRISRARARMYLFQIFVVHNKNVIWIFLRYFFPLSFSIKPAAI